LQRAEFIIAPAEGRTRWLSPSCELVPHPSRSTGLAAPRPAGRRNGMGAACRRVVVLKISPRERQQALDIEMGLDVIGKRVERAVHLAAIAFG